MDTIHRDAIRRSNADLTVARSSTGSPGRIRVAFYGRSAGADDPHRAITRQLTAVRSALPTGAVIVACFADVGAWDGLTATARSGVEQCTGWVLGEHTVTGGFLTLLVSVGLSPSRRQVRGVPAYRHLADPGGDPGFDVVACSDAERLSRKTHRQQGIEAHLAACGVGVFTSDGSWELESMVPAPTAQNGRVTWLPPT